MAYFNGGQYELAIDAFEENRRRGGPDAPNMEAYRAATYAALGREAEAREVIANLNVSPGEISPESWIRRWTPVQKNAEKAIAALHRLGMKDRTGVTASNSPLDRRRGHDQISRAYYPAEVTDWVKVTGVSPLVTT